MKLLNSSSTLSLLFISTTSLVGYGCATAEDTESSGTSRSSTGGGAGATGTGGGDVAPPTGGSTSSGGSSSATGGGSATGGSSTVTCEDEETRCSGSCVVLGTDAHCSECDDACVTGSACVDGDAGAACACQTETETLCTAGCFDTQTSLTNCGGCDQACGDNAASCTAGECVCESGFFTCEGETGCFDTQTDSTHCGASCEVCASTDVCEAGSCVCNESEPGISECGGECIATVADASNCGGCGVTCDDSCVNGTCEATVITGTQVDDTGVQTFTATAEGDYSVTAVDTTCGLANGTLGCNGGANFEVILVVDGTPSAPISGSYYASGAVPVVDSTSEVRLKVTGDTTNFSCTLGCYN